MQSQLFIHCLSVEKPDPFPYKKHSLIKPIVYIGPGPEFPPLLARLLATLGYREERMLAIRPAASLPDNTEPALLFLDLEPGLESDNLLLALRQCYPYTPFIDLSTARRGMPLVQDHLELNRLDTYALEKSLAYARERISPGQMLAAASLFERSPHPMWIYDAQSLQFLTVNQAACQQYGYPESRFLGMKLTDLLPPDDLACLAESMQGEFAPNFLDQGRWRHRRHDGTDHFVQLFAHAVSYHGREARFMQAIDANEKVKTERENRNLQYLLRSQKERLDGILASIQEIVYSCSADDYTMHYINDAAYEIFGYRPEELIGKKDLLSAMTHPDDYDRVIREAQNLRTHGKVFLEYRILDRAGQLKHITIQAILERDPETGLERINGVIRDVTERVLAEQRIREQARAISDTLESITDGFLSTDAHWKLTYVNPQMAQIMGMDRNEMIGTHVLDYFPDGEPAEFLEAYERVKRFGNSEHFEAFYPPKGIWMAVNVFPRKEGGLSIYVSDISQRVESEKRIQEQAVIMTDTLESITDGFFSTDAGWNIIYANSRMLQITSYSQEELLGMNLRDFFPDGEPRAILQAYERTSKLGISTHVEDFYPPLNIWISLNIYPRKEGGLAVYVCNITEQRQLQERIARNEHNLRAIINNTQDLIWSMDRNLEIISANEAFWQRLQLITGASRERITGALIKKTLKTAMSEEWAAMLQRALRGEAHTQVLQFDIAGSVRHEEVRFNPIAEEGNNIIGISCYARDITGQVRLQEKIRHEEEKLRALINNSKDMMWMVDSQLGLVSANHLFLGMVHELTGRVLQEGERVMLDEPEHLYPARWHAYYRRALDGEAFVFQEPMFWAGQSRIAEISFNPVFDADGAVTGISCTSRDVTERIHSMEQIRSQNERLQAIAWTQSHELRRPVANILGLIRLLMELPAESPAFNELLQALQLSTQELDETIHTVVHQTNA